MLLPLCGPSWWSITSSSGAFTGSFRKQHLIDQREDGGVGANAQGQREDGDRREERAAPEPPDGEAEVAQGMSVMRA